MCEQPMTLFRAGEVSLMHMPIHKQIQESYGYDQPILFFKEHPSLAYEICMRMEEKLTISYVILRQSMDSMTQHAEVLTKNYKENMALKDSVLQARDECINAKNECLEHLRNKCNAEQIELKSQLARTNNEILKLAHSLSVRGMIEKIECQFSDRRRREGAHASRKAVWMEILDENERIRRAVISTCTGKNMACKVAMAIEAIVEIYRRASDEIHNAGYDEIPVRIGVYHGQELDILRNLCAAANYLIKEI
jgi:uncharacterized protein YigA (DUF484 family)